MSVTILQGWSQGLDAWLRQPGNDTEANRKAIDAQKKAAGVDPAAIRDEDFSDFGITDAKSAPAPKTQGPSYTPASAHSADDGAVGPAGGNYDQMIQRAADKYNVPASLIKAVIQQESGGNPNAVNPTSNCTGLMQLKPEYFGGAGVDLKDPATNIDLGTKELARLLKVKGNDPVATLAAYNLGEFADIDSTVPGQNGLTGRQYAQQVLERSDGYI